MQNDHLRSVSKFNIIKIKLNVLKYFNCMKVKCEIILPDVSLQHDNCIDTYRLISVSKVYR